MFLVCLVILMSWKGNISFMEDILAPMDEISIEFTGKNPFLICTIAMKMLRDIMKISSSNLREDDIRWDITGEPKGFYGQWRGKRTDDIWTDTLVIIIAQGSMDKERMGKVNIRMRGYLRTNFEYKNPISKNIWWMYNYLFYWKQRRAYLDFSRDNIMQIRQEILSAYNILKEDRYA